MNALATTLVAVGIFVVLVGVVLLVIKVQTSDSDTFKPIFQGPGRFMVSGPVGLVVIVIGVFCIVFSIVSYRVAASGNSANPAPSPTHPIVTPTLSPAPDSSSFPTPVAALTSPVDGAQVSRANGFTARGTESSLGSDTIWILDYDGGYTVDQNAVVTGGRWSASDYPLGDSSNHLPYNLTIVAALADPACATKLTKTNETNNDYLAQLPAGCAVFGQVTVDVTRP
jgi:hypothetical protein